MIQSRRERLQPEAQEGEEGKHPRRHARKLPRWPFAVGGGVVVVAVVAVVLWLLLARDRRPIIEVVVDRAPVKMGDKVVALVQLGDRFPILDMQGDWYQVSVPVGKEQRLGWLNVGNVRRIEPGSKDSDPVEVQIDDLDYVDVFAGEPKPYGKQWLYVEAQVRALKADSEGTCPIQTDRFVVSAGRLRYTSPYYWKTMTVGKNEITELVKSEVVRLPVGGTARLRLGFVAGLGTVIRRGWTIRYVPPIPGAIPKPPEATPATETPVAPPALSTAAPAAK